MRTTSLFAFVLASGVAVSTLTACDQEYDPDAPAIDPNAPRIRLVSPARGSFAGDVTHVTVTGYATDDEGVTSVTINGVSAPLAADGTFSAQVPVAAGTNLLHAVAKDAQGNTGKETRAVVAGALEPIATVVPQSITASMTAETFDALARGITGFLTGPNLTTTVQGMNPVINSGAPDGPDCLYAIGDVTKVTVGPASKITLSPQQGGVELSAVLDRPDIDMDLRYAVSCLDGSSDVNITANRVTITGVLRLGVNGDQFEIHLDDEDVSISGLDIDMTGVPGTIIDMITIESAIGPILAWAAERFAVPYVNNALAGLNETKTVDVLGTPVDIRVRPARIDVDIPGALIELDTELRAQGDTGAPGFVYTPNVLPEIGTRGFELAVADDAANQLLASYWAADGMEVGLDLANGSYGEVGRLYDRVELSAKVPPFLDASDKALRLTVGDLIATFKNGGAVATQVAVNAQVELKVAAGTDGALRLDVGQPTIHVDVLDENVDGANQLSNAQFEAVSSFALSRVVAFGSSALGAVPLPSFGGVSVQDVAIDEQAGYLVVGGEIQ